MPVWRLGLTFPLIRCLISSTSTRIPSCPSASSVSGSRFSLTLKTFAHLLRYIADQIKSGRTTVGNIDSEMPADIRLSGDNILPEHCYFESAADGKVTLHSLPNGTTMVNGQRIPSSKVCSALITSRAEADLPSLAAEGAAVWLSHHPRRLSRLPLQVSLFYGLRVALGAHLFAQQPPGAGAEGS